jgi:RNA polymerase sigma factor (sigma-70 family)
LLPQDDNCEISEDFFAAVRSRALEWATTRVDYDTAHDLATEVVLRVCERKLLDSQFLCAPGELDRFVATATRNAHVDKLRSDRRRSAREAVFESESRQRGRLWMCPEDQSSYSELACALDGALARTPRKRRAVYLMVQEEDMSYSSAAAELRVSPRTVESGVRRTRMQLRKDLAEFRVSQRPKRKPKTLGGAK